MSKRSFAEWCAKEVATRVVYHHVQLLIFLLLHRLLHGSEGDMESSIERKVHWGRNAADVTTNTLDAELLKGRNVSYSTRIRSKDHIKG